MRSMSVRNEWQGIQSSERSSRKGSTQCPENYFALSFYVGNIFFLRRICAILRYAKRMVWPRLLYMVISKSASEEEGHAVKQLTATRGCQLAWSRAGRFKSLSEGRETRPTSEWFQVFRGHVFTPL